MTTQPAWIRWLRAALEDVAYGTAPTSADEYNMNNGAWFGLVATSPLGAIKYAEEKLRTPGATGQRSTDQLGPVSGGRKSEGSLDIPVESAIIGLFFRAALGADSAADTDDTILLSAQTVDSDPETFLAAGFDNPITADFYPYIEIAVTTEAAGTFDAGTVVVLGTDPNDEVITETIVTPALGNAATYTVYTKLNYKTVVSIIINGFTAGVTNTVTATGISYTTHTITAGDVSASLTLDEHGDPGADTGKIQRYTGMVQEGLTLTFSALDEAGFVVVTPQLSGKFPTQVSDPTTRLPVLKAWPSWICSVTKGGSAYARIQNLTLNLNPGSRTHRAAVGSQDPQGKVDGARTVEFTGQLILEDNTEYAAWVTPTAGNYEFTFTSPYAATSTINHNLLLEATEFYFTILDPKEDNDLIVADFTAFTTAHVSDEVLKATLVNAVNGAY